MMNDHCKTVETNTEPCFIVTNEGILSQNAVLLGFYWYQGEDGEVAPRLNMDSDNVVYMVQEDIKRLISALQEFVE
jgi:hypothetical protein